MVVLEFDRGPGRAEVPLLSRNQSRRAIGTVPTQRELVGPLHRRFGEAQLNAPHGHWPVEEDPDLLLSHPSSLPSTSASTVKGSFDRIIGMLRSDFNGSHLRNVQPFARLPSGCGV